MSVKRRRSAEKWILDRSTLRRVRDRVRGKDHTVHYRLAQKYAEQHIPSPLEHFKSHRSFASGILLLDGKWVNILGESSCIHIAYDTGIGVVDYWIDCTENKQAYGFILRRLKDAGYELRIAVSDGHASLISLFEEENIMHQRCLFHLLCDLRRMLETYGELQGGDHILYSRLKYILKSKTLELFVSRLEEFRRRSLPWFATSKQRQAIQWFFEVLHDATVHLSFEAKEVPRTSNRLETLNGQIEARIKTFRGVKSERSLHNLLKILFRFRKYK